MLKKLDLTKKSFKGKSGETYYFEKDLSTERFKEYEKLQAEVGFGVDFSTMYDRLKQLYELLNKQKFADAAVLTNNMVTGISSNLNKRINPALQMATLMINTKDEDRGVWTYEMAEEKIADWSEYEVQGFFSFAVSLVNGLSEAYNEVILNTLEIEPLDMNTSKSEELV